MSRSRITGHPLGCTIEDGCVCPRPPRRTPEVGDRIRVDGRLSVVRSIEPADEFRPAGIVSSVVIPREDGSTFLGRSRDWSRLDGDSWAWPEETDLDRS